jgi:hypothetical protein
MKQVAIHEDSGCFLPRGCLVSNGEKMAEVLIFMMIVPEMLIFISKYVIFYHIRD